MIKFTPTNRRSISAIKAAKILKEHGTEVSMECANLILDFLYKFAKLSAGEVISRDSGIELPDKKTPRKLFR